MNTNIEHNARPGTTIITEGVVPTAPAPVDGSAEVIVSGQTLEIVFSLPVTSGSATAGFTWTGGSILSGSYAGDTLTLVVAPVITGGAGGTLSYDSGAGSLAGAGGDVASFGPVAVTNNSTFAGTWSQTGSAASFPGGTTTITKFGADNFDSTDIVIIDEVSDAVRAIRYSGSAWGALGSSYSIASLTVPGVCVLDATTVAVFKSNATAGLFALSWNGSTFSTLGTQTNITGANQGIALCRLSATRLLLVDSQSDYMRAYDWNGSTFSAVGNSLSIGGINGVIRADALTSTLVVLSESSTGAINLYSFDGTDWSAVAGSTLSADTVLGYATAYPCVCAINATDIVVADYKGKVQVMRWSGSVWAATGSAFTISQPSTSGSSALVSIGSNAVAYLRASTSNSVVTRLLWA